MVTCTPAAAEQIRTQLNKRGHGVGLRVGVKTSGCSGLAYVLEFCDSLTDMDEPYESHGVTLVVDKKASPFLQGTVLDYVKKGLNAGFEFQNPNELDRCGCGESFRV